MNFEPITIKEKDMSMDKNGVSNQLVRGNRWPRKPVEKAGKDCPKCGAAMFKPAISKEDLIVCSKYSGCKYSEGS